MRFFECDFSSLFWMLKCSFGTFRINLVSIVFHLTLFFSMAIFINRMGRSRPLEQKHDGIAANQAAFSRSLTLASRRSQSGRAILALT